MLMIIKMIPGGGTFECLPLQGNTDTDADPTSPGRCLKPHSNPPAMETTNQASDKHTNPQFDISTYLGPLPAPFLGVDLRLP